MPSEQSFGTLLRQLRESRGWSQTRFAELLQETSGRFTVTRGEVARWERGKRRPRSWLPSIAAVLDVSQTMLERATVEPAEPVRPDPATTLAELLPPGDPLAPLSAREGRTVGMDAARDLAGRVHALRLADDVLSGGDLLRPARRELAAAVRLVRESSHTDRAGRALLVCVGELAQITGWIISDAGDHDEAERVYRLGLAAAREAGDRALAGNLAGSLAYQWSNTGRPLDGAALAAAAVEETGAAAPGTARALALDRLAWAHAQAGEAQPAMQALVGAHEALADDVGTGEPAWAYWVCADELRVMDARVLTELRRPLRAVPVLSEVLAAYDATHTRELALYLSWLAVAYLDANEPEAAAAAASRMLRLSSDVASDRTTSRAGVVLKRLAGHQDVPEVRAVVQAARSS